MIFKELNKISQNNLQFFEITVPYNFLTFKIVALYYDLKFFKTVAPY